MVLTIPKHTKLASSEIIVKSPGTDWRGVDLPLRIFSFDSKGTEYGDGKYIDEDGSTWQKVLVAEHAAFMLHSEEAKGVLAKS